MYPDLLEFSDEIVHPFRDQTRSFCNYLERKLKSVKFKTENFRRICIIGSSSPNDDCFVNSSNVLSVQIKLDETEYKSITNRCLNDYFIRLLMEGLNKIDKEIRIPKQEIVGFVNNFKADGYLNEWVFKTRQFKSIGIKCRLNCRLTTEKFHLNFLILKGSKILFDQEILKTAPDELVFASRLKDIREENRKIIVVDKFDESLFELSCEDLEM
ncbi:MAG: hypothetical protein GKS00_21785 [Alphaproteobacteria bacterium]|nr:hypothetical protein [Alphaproteobacteria bacterium]